ncbi:MAG: cytochrome c family protein [Candidatus Anammoxibacter sp.]
MRWFLFPVFLLSIIVMMTATPAEAQGKAKYVGSKKCGRCHGNERRSWAQTSHAKAFDLLKAGAKGEEKKKVGLDPEKNYTEDEKCLPCHTTGYGERGGFMKDMDEEKAVFFRGVTCEMCHGIGSLYRKEHSAAEDLFLNKKKASPRKVLVETGQIFDYEEACAGCHLNYEGSSWKKAKKPYTPFTPMVDKKYVFDFDERVRKVPTGIHDYYKLTGIFEGPPVPKMRAEFQKNAKETVE